ncbi:MAG: hypothetical protein R3C11_10280 [Planctomycetaceae bacterium]
MVSWLSRLLPKKILFSNRYLELADSRNSSSRRVSLPPLCLEENQWRGAMLEVAKEGNWPTANATPAPGGSLHSRP